MNIVSIALIAGFVGCACAQPVAAANATTYKETVLHSFGGGKDGQYPVSGLTNVNGTLYGTTYGGGNADCNGYGCGTVFSIDPDTGVETVVYSFCTQRRCADGAAPDAGLINVNGLLYGTTEVGGRGARCRYKGGCGTVFSFDPGTGVETVLYSFCSRSRCRDGWYASGLVATNGRLYGTTTAGGAAGAGTAFLINPDTGAERVLHSFCSQQDCADGANPIAGLIAAKGVLYGTTTGGGNTGCHHFSTGCGTLFSLDRKTGAETVLHPFCSQPNCTDGGNPAASLIAVDGKLYGTTYDGGVQGCTTDGCGTVFSFDPGADTETVLYAFCQQTYCPDGALPFAGVIDVKGTLYGTTAYGGRTGCPQTGDCGTVFSLDPGTGSETVLYAFCNLKNCTDGWAPQASLIAVNEALYGTTYAGGTHGDGTVFAITKNGRSGGAHWPGSKPAAKPAMLRSKT